MIGPDGATGCAFGALPPWLTWAFSPSGPQRSSRALPEGVAALSDRYGLPVLTHVYETRAQAGKAVSRRCGG